MFNGTCGGTENPWKESREKTENKMKNDVIRILRWIAMLPAAVLATFIVFFICKVIYLLLWIPSGFFGGGLIVDFVSNIIGSGVFVFAGAMVSPTERKDTSAVVLSIIYVVLTLIYIVTIWGEYRLPLILHIILAILLIMSSIFGSVYSCAILKVYKE